VLRLGLGLVALLGPAACGHDGGSAGHRAASGTGSRRPTTTTVAATTSTRPTTTTAAPTTAVPTTLAPTTAASTTTTTAPPAPERDWLALMVTYEGDDGYEYTPEGDGLVFRAAASNVGENVRAALVDGGLPVTADQRACTTWVGPREGIVQPGVVLRASEADGAVRGIMVTDNIYAGHRQTVNVHLIDTAAPRTLELVAQLDLSDGLGTFWLPHPMPWRFCASVTGRTLTVRAGSVAAGGDLPATARPHLVELPEHAPAEGRPGVYVGHLAPGGVARYERVDLADRP